MTATIALVGRPNVGKSTLYNRMIGGRPALVHDTPGLTRDRRYGELDYFGRIVRVIDTGGLDPAAEGDAIGRGIHRQAWRAIEEADALVLVVDGAAGLAPLDAEVVQRLPMHMAAEHEARLRMPGLCRDQAARGGGAVVDIGPAFRMLRRRMHEQRVVQGLRQRQRGQEIALRVRELRMRPGRRHLAERL